MSDEALLEVSASYSPNEDWSRPVSRVYFSDTEAPTKKLDSVVSAATGGTTVELGSLGTVAYLVIYNRDTTNYVDATFRSAGNGSTNNILRLAAGKMAVLSDVTAGNDLILTANTAACVCDIFGWGS